LPGAVAWIDCVLQVEHEGGDHAIAVAAVEDLAADTDSSPLLFHRGRYAKVS
jgi:flavin reductase (DIM6/NTAB) family NADH-FMN oxidoreductase RutF